MHSGIFPCMAIRVSIVEDHAPYRERLEALINGAPGFVCVGAHATAESARSRIPPEKPDVVLADLELPGLWGQTVISDLKAVLPQVEIVILTVHDEPKLIFQGLEAGASGYLVKPVAPEQILEAIAEVHRGGAPMSSGVARLVLRTFHERGQARRQLTHLTPREYEIVDLVAKGYHSKEIAVELNITVPTVRTHLHNIYEKLHVGSRAAATAKYLGGGSQGGTPEEN